jgi:glycosyltransferase involved in cell wall biosynthesis
MLGLGWFPSTVGGLDRYYRALFEQLPQARGVVVGPADGAPQTIESAAGHDTPLPVRLWRYRRAARRAGRESELLDAHFALYAAGPMLLDRKGRPSVFHFQGPWAEENVAARDTSRLRFALRRALERLVLERADAHVVLSSPFRRLLVERYRIAPWNVHVWPPGVALDAFQPGEQTQARERLGLERDVFVATTVRRLVPRMGIDVLLDAWAQLEGALPAGSQLLIVGDGPLAGELAERASQPPLAGRVRLLGRVDDAELLDVYRAADVAVVPTVAFEGFGLVVLEAAACGTPSIVSDLDGLREATSGLDRSLLVAPGDGEALRERLARAATGGLPDRDRTRRHAEGFSWPAVAERHRALYGRLLSGKRDTRLRVVYLDHVARLSGGEIALLRLLPHMREVNAHVILGEDGLLLERLQEAGISVELLAFPESAREVRRESVRPGAAAGAAALRTLAYAARLAWRLRSLRPDLIHSNSLKSGVYGGLAARAAGVPLLWHLRDRLAPDYLPRSVVAAMRRTVGLLADGVVANSPDTLQTLPDAVRERGWVIPDSVEVPAATERAQTGHVTFGMLGRIAPWKGQDLFLHAFAAAFAGGEERAVIVGEPMFGEAGYERELHELVAALGLDGRVEFRGFREDVWAELHRFEVLVHCSVIPEPFGQVVIEGMAAGLAVIAPDEGGPREMVDDGRTGRLFASRDRDALAAAMRSLAGDPDLRRRLGAAAREEARAYDPRVLARRFEDAYAQVLARRGGD